MRRALAILFAAGALAVAAAGCGEDDSAATPAATSTPAPTEDRGAYGY